MHTCMHTCPPRMYINTNSQLSAWRPTLALIFVAAEPSPNLCSANVHFDCYNALHMRLPLEAVWKQ